MSAETEFAGRIVSDPAVMMGKPVIRGTRITVEHILTMFGSGHDEASVRRAHPHLSTDDIRAAQNYAAENLRQWRVIAAE